MEDLVEKAPFLFEEQVSGCVFKELDEAINQLVDSAAGDVFRALKRDGQTYSKGGNEILENKKEILETIRRLKVAIESPLKLINEYKSSK